MKTRPWYDGSTKKLIKETSVSWTNWSRRITWIIIRHRFLRSEDQIAENDKVVTRLTSYGRHEGDLPGAPRTGNEMKITSITIHRVANGKLVEKWSEKDVMALLIAIGVMRKPGHTGA